MAFRGGRGGGRGRGRGGFGVAKQLSFELFPEIEELGDASKVEEAKVLGIWYSKFDRYYKSSPYHIEDGVDSSKKLKIELETFSNRGSGRNAPKGRLSDFIYMDHNYVPGELAKGDKTRRIGVKRVIWNNPETDKLQMDDLFARKFEEHKQKVKEANMMKGEEEEEVDGIIEEEDDELDEGDDYLKTQDFDDDEDPYNVDEDNNADDEGGDYS